MEWTSIALFVLAGLLVLVGTLGTALPALPGVLMVFAGLLLAAWTDGFVHVGTGMLVVLGLLAALTYAVDFAAGALGAQRVGASRRALIGAVLGGLVGLFMGIAGAIVGPFVGAVIGEYTVQRNLSQAGRVGFGTWLGMAVGLAAKLALVFAMLALFVLALFF
ncbi:MAG: DUF456 domain-containing protein [Deltaproteobacteria bacterium]|nr:DUF456 domain-containing protein [Deltaproteobacteria bacterium]MBW2360533.1 DUF456 domain-containing protein [Deltaproteobacteria bacterium]